MPMRQNKIVNPASTLQAMVTFGSTVSSDAIVEETDKRNVPHAPGFLIKQWKWNFYQCSLVIFFASNGKSRKHDKRGISLFLSNS